MQVILKVGNEKANVKQIVLQTDTLIGRSQECQLKVASSQVSRRHCQIKVHDHHVTICDLGSSNGTLVNGLLIPPQVDVPLTPGTQVAVGPLQFTVLYTLTTAIRPSSLDETLDWQSAPTSESNSAELAQIAPAADQPQVTFSDVPPEAPAARGGAEAKTIETPKPPKATPLPAAVELPNEPVLAPNEQTAQPPQAMPVPVVVPVAENPAPATVEMPESVAIVEPEADAALKAGADLNPEPEFPDFAIDTTGDEAATMQIDSAPQSGPAADSDAGQPAARKRGFFDFLGLGRKKKAAEESAPAAETGPVTNSAPEPEVEIPEEAAAESDVVVPDADTSEVSPVAATESGSATEETEDESLGAFFQQFD